MNVQVTAEAPAGMTLAELEAFTADARQHGATGAEPVKVRAGWSQQIRKATITITRQETSNE